MFHAYWRLPSRRLPPGCQPISACNFRRTKRCAGRRARQAIVGFALCTIHSNGRGDEDESIWLRLSGPLKRLLGLALPLPRRIRLVAVDWRRNSADADEAKGC